MRQSETGGNLANNSTQSTFRNFTKQELSELLQGRIVKPLSAVDLYRCAASALSTWCDDIVADRYASMYDLTRKLEALQAIYQNK